MSHPLLTPIIISFINLERPEKYLVYELNKFLPGFDFDKKTDLTSTQLVKGQKFTFDT